MLLHILVLAILEHSRRHVGVLDTVIGKERRRKNLVQVHLCKPICVLPGNFVITGPERLLLLIGESDDPVFEHFRLIQKYRELCTGEGIRVHPAILIDQIGRPDNAHRDFSVVFLLLPDIVCLDHFLFWIREQRERQPILHEKSHCPC